MIIQRKVKRRPDPLTLHPVACKADPELYELLALADAIRDGRARERKIEEKKFDQGLRSPVKKVIRPFLK